MPSAAVRNEDDILNILLATDIHLGYAEKNPERAQDSFTTFEEILQIAKAKRVDMVLLGGDLFHENKPSRFSEMKCIDILRQHVLGSEPVSFQLISDPETNFKHCERKHVNFMDPDMNIGLPIFSIHGNHDDPSGLGGYSCMDTMHATGLLNYFGKITNLEEVLVSPLLIQKGETKLALYGMSSIKDERLHRLFRANKVSMLRPEEETDSWFNMLVLHQNRAKHGPTNYIPEHFIDNFIDLAFWGHEHECRIEPETASANREEEYRITQPGSSVATSLCAGEAMDKFVGLLSIHKKDFKIDPIPLQTVRPLIFKTISLDESGIQFIKNEKEMQKRIEAYLKTYVEELIIDAEQKSTGHEKQPKLPLIRLRVEYTDESHQLIPARFGNHFHNKVANPSEILLFRKKPVERLNGADGDLSILNSEVLNDLGEMANLSMEDFVAEYFRNNTDDKGKLKLLGIKGIGAAVKNFIDKDDKESIGIIVEKQLKKSINKLEERKLDQLDDDRIDEELGHYQEERAQAQVNETNEANEMLATNDRKAKPRKARADDIEMDSEEGEVSDFPTPATNNSTRTSQPPTRGRARGRGAARGSSARGSSKKNPVVASQQQNSIQNAFSRQSQNSTMNSRASASKRPRAKVVDFVDESDSD